MAAARRRPAEAGYTLVEALAALFIIALASGFVIASMPEPVDDRSDAAASFAAKLLRAGEEAVVSGLVVGVAVDADGYGFHRRVAGDWIEIGDRAGLDRRRWPADVLVNVELQGAPLDASRLADLPPSEDVPPILRFEPTGAATPAFVAVTSPDLRAEIRLSVSGAVELELENEP